MSEAGGEKGRLLADLERFLRQRQGDGWDWILTPAEDAPLPPTDAGPAAPAAASAPAPVVEPVSPVVADPPRETVVTPAPAERRAAAARPEPAPAAAMDGKDGFTLVCEKFVSETLARIDRNRAVAPAQENMFDGGDERPRVLDREQKAAALAALATEVAPCTGCKLHADRTQTVFGTGDPDADLVLIGEAPGRDEDLQGEPFVGRGGKLLNEILKAIGFAREDVFICNILKCRPPNNRDPERDEVDACEPYLKRQLEIISPRVICCLGRVSAQTLLNTRASLTALRESVHFYEGVPVMATYHPAALLRNPNWKRPTWDDVRKLRALHDALRERS